MSAITTAPAQVGNGKAVHYVRKDAFHSHTIGCGRPVSRELTAQEAADRKACGPCKRAVEVLATEPPAETEAPPPTPPSRPRAPRRRTTRPPRSLTSSGACAPWMPTPSRPRPCSTRS